MDESKNNFRHTLTLEHRRNLSITGVTDVISFDEETIVSDTDMGILIIHGKDLHVNKLNLDDGELEIDGEITALKYETQNTLGKNKSSSFFSRIFK